MLVTAIVLAAGRGIRFSRPNSSMIRGGIPAHISKMIESGKSRIAKPLVKIRSRPMVIYSLLALSNHPEIKDIIVTANPLNCKDIIKAIKQYRIKKIKAVVLGGKERQDSVRKALAVIDRRAELILIHDAARPFITRWQISGLIREAKRSSAAILGVPVKATIKEAGGSQFANRKVARVARTLNRDRLWEIQTPQVFSRDLILDAYARYGNAPVTDDAMLVEKLGAPVSLVLGSYDNIKITTPEDLVIAEAIAKNNEANLN